FTIKKTINSQEKNTSSEYGKIENNIIIPASITQPFQRSNLLTFIPARSSSAMPKRFLKNILKNPKPKIMASQMIKTSISHLQSLYLFYGDVRQKFQKIIEKASNRLDGFNRLSPKIL